MESRERCAARRWWRGGGVLFVGNALAAGALGFSGAPIAAQNLPEDPFVDMVLGEWLGQGEYDGNMLDLTRTWTLELLDQFLRGDMRVSMSNGFTFGAFMYWRVAAPGVYDVTWMDGMGRSQALRATYDAETGMVSSTYLDELAEGGPEWRTWEFESMGPDAYVERLYRLADGGPELLTVFSFDRVDRP